jgi:hypothetical protein
MWSVINLLKCRLLRALFLLSGIHVQKEQTEEKETTKSQSTQYTRKRKRSTQRNSNIQLSILPSAFLFRRRFSSWTLALALRNVDIACCRPSKHSSANGAFCLRNNSRFLALVAQQIAKG